MLPKPSANHSGFTLVELVVTMGIIGIILALSTILLSPLIPKEQTNTTAQILISDLATQQQRAITGDQLSPDGHYGIFFAPQAYTLFFANTYSEIDPQNIVVDLPENQTFTSIDLPNHSIVFTPISGEVKDWDVNASSAALLNAGIAQPQTISINTYGTVFVQ